MANTELTTRRVLGYLLLAVIIAGALLATAWTSMNLGTFACFSAVVVWIIAHERLHYRSYDGLAVAERRLRALEERCGIRRAFEDEVEAASEQREWYGGRLADNLHWPDVRDLTRWRRKHWRAWDARL